MSTPNDTPSIDDLVALAKTNWCAFSHGHGMLRGQSDAIDQLAALARTPLAPAAPAPTVTRDTVAKIIAEGTVLTGRTKRQAVNAAAFRIADAILAHLNTEGKR